MDMLFAILQGIGVAIIILLILWSLVKVFGIIAYDTERSDYLREQKERKKEK